MDIEMGGREKRGRPRTRWKDCVVVDSRENNSDLGTVKDKISWRLIKSKEMG